MTRKRLSNDALDYFRQQGARGGRRAGQTMTPAERKARAAKASHAAAVVRTQKAQARKTKG